MIPCIKHGAENVPLHPRLSHVLMQSTSSALDVKWWLFLVNVACHGGDASDAAAMTLNHWIVVAVDVAHLCASGGTAKAVVLDSCNVRVVCAIVESC